MTGSRSDRRFWMRLGLVTCLAALAPLVGCQRPAFPVAPVHGKVMIDGQPLTEGKVMFAPIAQGGGMESGKPAFGPLQGDGSFVLSTYSDNDGAVVGEHWVSIIAPPTTGVSPKHPNIIRVTVPRKFTVLADEDNEIQITLNSREIARFGRRKP